MEKYVIKKGSGYCLIRGNILSTPLADQKDFRSTNQRNSSHKTDQSFSKKPFFFADLI